MTDDSSQALDDAIRVERMALDSGPNADRNLGALAREVRRTQLAIHKVGVSENPASSDASLWETPPV